MIIKSFKSCGGSNKKKFKKPLTSSGFFSNSCRLLIVRTFYIKINAYFNVNFHPNALLAFLNAISIETDFCCCSVPKAFLSPNLPIHPLSLSSKNKQNYCASSSFFVINICLNKSRVKL